jgi:hypothetical protein
MPQAKLPKEFYLGGDVNEGHFPHFFHVRGYKGLLPL